MRRFWPRLLRSVLPITLLCGAAGYLYAIAAGAYIADERDDGGTLRDALAWRVPLAMAFWGGGVTLVVEWFRHLWGVNKKGEKKVEAALAPEQSAEQLLMQLIEQAEAAEESRKFLPPPAPVVPSVTDTPLPVALQPVDAQSSPVS